MRIGLGAHSLCCGHVSLVLLKKTPCTYYLLQIGHVRGHRKIPNSNVSRGPGGSNPARRGVGVAASPSLFVAVVSYGACSGAAVESGGSLRLSSVGDLQLVNGCGAVLWSSGTAGRGIVAAALRESGNLVLKNSKGGTVWKSFDHPMDIMVRSQSFTSGMKLTSGSYVFAVDYIQFCSNG